MDASSSKFNAYVNHVLKWEGNYSSDPNDTAATCFPGGVHTVKGITYCTFLANASQLGIVPVTHPRFLEMSDDDVARFIFLFMNKAGATVLPDPIALSVTEAAWGSGADRAVRHLQDALNDLKGPGTPLTVDGINGPKTTAAALAQSDKALFDQYWIERKKYLDDLIANGYSQYAKGWYNRMSDFIREFAPGGISLALGLLLIAMIVTSLVKTN